MIDKIKQAWRGLSWPMRVGATAALVFFVVYGFLVLYSGAQEARAAQAEAAAAAERIISDKLAKTAAAADVRAAEAEVKALALEEEVNRLKSRRSSLPTPKPTPAPDDEQLHVQLIAAGLVNPPLYRPDAVQIWEWREGALSVPLWVEKLAASDAVVKAQDDQIGAQRGAIAEFKKGSENWRLANEASVARAANLDAALAATKRQVKAQKAQKYWLMGGALVTGYLVGRK